MPHWGLSAMSGIKGAKTLGVKSRPVQPCPSGHTSPLTLQPDALGNHLEADDAVCVLLVLFQVLPVVVKDEREVIVQVDLKQRNKENKIARSQETTRKTTQGDQPGIRSLPSSSRPNCTSVPKTLLL